MGLTQGYDADHVDIDLLRLRNYTIGRKLTEQEVIGADILDRISDLLSMMKPFVSSPALLLRYGSAPTRSTARQNSNMRSWLLIIPHMLWAVPLDPISFF